MTIGHNGELKAFVERIEKLAEDKRQIAHDMNFVYAEAKATGFDTKIIRKVVALRQKEATPLSRAVEHFGNMSKLAAATGYSQHAVWCAVKRNRVSPAMAAAIHKSSKGKIKRADLRPAKRDEEQALLDTYMAALGMLADLPLGQAAIKRDGVA